jgi:hypothetical protein
MAMIPTATDHVSFWAGCPDGMTPWEYGNTGKDYTADTPFYVTSKGLLHCSNIQATGGSIGGWEITPNYLAKYAEGDDFANNRIFRDGDALICPSGINANLTIAGNISNDWILGVGENFGITATGAVYANKLIAKEYGTLGPY